METYQNPKVIPEDSISSANVPVPLWKDFLYLGIKIAVIILIIWGIFTFIFGAFRYNSNDMYPSLKSGDLVFTYRLDKDYISGDVVALNHDGKIIVGRVVGLSGDTVNITEEGLSVNDILLSEPNITGETRRYAEGIDFPITLSENQVFLLCDNRENATDSRIYGPISVKDSLGTVIMFLRRRGI